MLDIIPEFIPLKLLNLNLSIRGCGNRGNRGNMIQSLSLPLKEKKTSPGADAIKKFTHSLGIPYLGV